MGSWLHRIASQVKGIWGLGFRVLGRVFTRPVVSPGPSTEQGYQDPRSYLHSSHRVRFMDGLGPVWD